MEKGGRALMTRAVDGQRAVLKAYESPGCLVLSLKTVASSFQSERARARISLEIEDMFFYATSYMCGCCSSARPSRQ